jgi:HD-GYP domain-containing protein (c-di-GMP phosphodiesterase class II)
MFKSETQRLKSRFHFPLHIHTATLFIVLTISLGAGQVWFNYQKNTELIRDGSAVLYENVMQKAYMDMKAKYDMAANSVEIMAEGDIANAKNLAQRLDYLPVISKILKANDAVSGFEVGYANGDFFIIRSIYNEYMREQFKAPFSTVYMVDNIKNISSEDKQGVRIYYDKHLNEISQKALKNQTYDPRVRPWYKLALASKSFATTNPYLYFFVKKVGITITLESKNKGTVIAADIALDELSETLKKNIITPSAELVLFDESGKVMAYKQPNKLIVKNANGKDAIASIDQLDSPVLNYYAQKIEPKEQQLSFRFDSQHWGGVIKKIEINSDFNLYFSFIAPDDELFSDAIEIRWQSSLIALVLILIAVPITAYSAYRISEPLRKLTIQTRRIAQFDFSSTELPNSMINEIHILSSSMEGMRTTISHFLSMIKSLAGEKDLDSLLATITRQTLEISQADAAVLYLLNEEGTHIDPVSIKLASEDYSEFSLKSHEIANSRNFMVRSIKEKAAKVHNFKRRGQNEKDILTPFFENLNTDDLQILTLPLNNRSGEVTGILCVINDSNNSKTENLNNDARIGFMQTLSGFAAVSMESRHLLKSQSDLMASFIKLIAGAIDAKSHYTAGHCQRVPELTRMLAEEACAQQSGEFKEFSLSQEQWEELEIAAWLHDCGKITTPEYVVDKATKLETIYDRIHEIRMRFELLKCEAELNCWKDIAEGNAEDIEERKAQMNQLITTLDEEFSFIAQCNIGSESMSDESIDRVKHISQRRWKRTISDRLGISWEEALRKDRTKEATLPVMENVLDDRLDHIIERHPKDVMPVTNKWGFNVKTPEHQYNRGELYNLCIPRGTLNAEERYKINEHIIQTIIMLDELKFPKNLSNVREIAGGHHEKMDGTGYPKRLCREDMSVSARMMAIADIFEALTAHDRPYKKAKKLSEAIKIMSFMKKDQHIDGPLFDLFLSTGIYLKYAQKNLSPDQIDFVDLSNYLQKPHVNDAITSDLQPMLKQ